MQEQTISGDMVSVIPRISDMVLFDLIFDVPTVDEGKLLECAALALSLKPGEEKHATMDYRNGASWEVYLLSPQQAYPQ